MSFPCCICDIAPGGMWQFWWLDYGYRIFAIGDVTISVVCDFIINGSVEISKSKKEKVEEEEEQKIRVLHVFKR